MFGVGSGEILLLLLIVFIVYGPNRLPDLASKLGKFTREIRRAGEEVKTAITKELTDGRKE